jgi:hypothetical protein
MCRSPYLINTPLPVIEDTRTRSASARPGRSLSNVGSPILITHELPTLWLADAVVPHGMRGLCVCQYGRAIVVLILHRNHPNLGLRDTSPLGERRLFRSGVPRHRAMMPDRELD